MPNDATASSNTVAISVGSSTTLRMRWWSKSMNAMTMDTHANTYSTGSAHNGYAPNSPPAVTARKDSPPSDSTSGYRAAIGSLQCRHFAPSANQEKMGILSYQAIGDSHFGQKLRFGLVMLMWFGTRHITTFRKDPKIQPMISEATSSITTVGTSFTISMPFTTFWM